jgi:AraC-like DNA-binding protein
VKISNSPHLPRFALEAVELHGIGQYRHPIPIRIPPFYERVELVTNGRGWIMHEGGWREVLPGDLVWNRPGDDTIGRGDLGHPYGCLWVDVVSRKQHGLGLPRFSRWRDLEAVRAFAEECARLFQDENFDRATLRDYAVGQLVLRVRLHAAEFEREEWPQALQAAIARLERDFAQPCRIGDLAVVSGWSVAHLHEMFRKHLGITPHRMLVQLRLRAAKARLAATNEAMKQIAFECGFSDPAAFANVFKTNTGMTPGEYRSRRLRLTA